MSGQLKRMGCCLPSVNLGAHCVMYESVTGQSTSYLLFYNDMEEHDFYSGDKMPSTYME